MGTAHPRQDLWTREQFEAHVRDAGVELAEKGYVLAILPCRCGDLACHGWRLVVSTAVSF